MFIHYFQNPSKAQFIESLKRIKSTGAEVDSSEALEAFKNWIHKTSGLPQHDHAMLFTRCSPLSIWLTYFWGKKLKRSIHKDFHSFYDFERAFKSTILISLQQIIEVISGHCHISHILHIDFR